MKWLAAALAIKTLCHLPVMLPQNIPGDPGAPMYAIVEQRQAGFYTVDFAAVPDCNGAHACSYAHVTGSAKALPLGYARSVCAAYCNDASFTFKRGGAYYQLTLKAGTPAQLRAMAASMRRY